jgi:hypothetical protein
MTTTKPARRPRRIAADEAHAWARSLNLRNHSAKHVLKSLTMYVDGEGECFVGIPDLAADCDMSADTVRRRLVWLEHIGAISRIPQWQDNRGVRNAEGRGKRTTDLIRLLVDADVETIEAAARGDVRDNAGDEDGGFSPSNLRGLNPETEPASPRPALVQPSQCCDHLISEPEPEQVDVDDDARARGSLISKAAIDLADRLMIIAGHDPKFTPPGWCGAAMRVQTWLSQGWPPEIIEAAAKAATMRKTGPPPATVQYFERAIAEEIARQSAPLPTV